MRKASFVPGALSLSDVSLFLPLTPPNPRGPDGLLSLLEHLYFDWEQSVQLKQ